MGNGVDIQNKIHQKLKTVVVKGEKSKDQELMSFMAVWTEIEVVQDLVCRGERIVGSIWATDHKDVKITVVHHTLKL